MQSLDANRSSVHSTGELQNIIRKEFYNNDYKTPATGSPTPLRVILHSLVAEIGVKLCWKTSFFSRFINQDQKDEHSVNLKNDFEKLNQLFPGLNDQERSSIAHYLRTLECYFDFSHVNFPPTVEEAKYLLSVLSYFRNRSDSETSYTTKHINIMANKLGIELNVTPPFNLPASRLQT